MSRTDQVVVELRCDVCSQPAIACKAGDDAVVQLGIVLAAAVPERHWCLACWPCRPLERAA